LFLEDSLSRIILGNYIVDSLDFHFAAPFADDYVIATGETHSVREFLDETFAYLNLDWHEHVVIDSKYYRPTEVDFLLGDASKAKRVLGWEPKVRFKELVRLMIDAEMTNG